MKLNLFNRMYATPLYIAMRAIRVCWKSEGKSDSTPEKMGPRDLELIYRVGRKYKHTSTLQHIIVVFNIKTEDVGTVRGFPLYRLLTECPFSYVTSCPVRGVIISINLCAILGLNEAELIAPLLPAEYQYLLKD